MNHRRDRFCALPQVGSLEPRQLLSRLPRSGMGLVASVREAKIHPLEALNPAAQNQQFVNTTNYRRSIATSVTHRVNEAFQAFAYHELHVPLTIRGSTQPVAGIPLGTTPNPPTPANSLVFLNNQVAFALATREIDTFSVPPSVSNGPRLSPMAKATLIPYATEQIATLTQELTSNPPQFHTDGSLAGSSSLNSLNAAYDAILDSIAETAVHPKLFRSPRDYFINPETNFTIKFDGDPVGAAPGFYTRGPGGVPLRAKP